MTARSPYSINIAGGSIFDPVNPTPDMIDPRGIMHHLAMLSRWGGNVQYPYSVLQHSIIVAEAMSNPAERIYGFIHDWPEALLGADIVSPTKLLLEEAGASVIARERKYINVIYQALSLPSPSRDIANRVHIADMRALSTELRDVVDNTRGIVCTAPPLDRRITKQLWHECYFKAVPMLDAYLALAAKAGA